MQGNRVVRANGSKVVPRLATGDKKVLGVATGDGDRLHDIAVRGAESDLTRVL